MINSIINDPSQQLFFPEIRPYFTQLFKNKCGHQVQDNEFRSFEPLDCNKPAALLALYLRYGFENEDIRTEEKVYACTQAHLEEIIRRMNQEKSDPDPLPSVIVNAMGIPEDDIRAQIVAAVTGEHSPTNYFFVPK